MKAGNAELGLTNESIGFRLKMLRLSKGMTAKSVAEALGVSPAYISMLERGKSNYNFALLLRLMNIYGESLSDFFKSQEETDQIRRFENMPHFSEDKGKLTYRLLRAESDPNVLRTYHFRQLPGGSTGIHEQHIGTEYVYVLEGECVLTLASPGSSETKRYVLRATDSIYFLSSVSHCIKNESDAPCSFLLVYSPYMEENGELKCSEKQHPVVGK